MLRSLISLFLGLGLGVVAALVAAGVLFPGFSNPGTKVVVGPWAGDWTTGSTDASPRHRAWVAVNGLLAMSSDEAVYFVAETDDAGNPLSEDCSYRITGGEQSAYWWSITLYDAGGFLPLNDGAALSIDATQAGSGSWSARIAATEQPDQSLRLSSKNAQDFNLLLRLYRPSPRLLEHPSEVLNAPRIEQLECGL